VKRARKVTPHGCIVSGDDKINMVSALHGSFSASSDDESKEKPRVMNTRAISIIGRTKFRASLVIRMKLWKAVTPRKGVGGARLRRQHSTGRIEPSQELVSHGDKVVDLGSEDRKKKPGNPVKRPEANHGIKELKKHPKKVIKAKRSQSQRSRG
jgi:hypothetical protein